MCPCSETKDRRPLEIHVSFTIYPADPPIDQEGFITFVHALGLKDDTRCVLKILQMCNTLDLAVWQKKYLLLRSC